MAFTSCVTKGKFLSQKKRVQDLQNDSVSVHNMLNDCNTNLAKIEKENSSIKNDLQNLSSNSQQAQESSKLTIAEQAKRLKDLQGLIQSQKDVLNKLKKTMADALINFKPDELTVSLKDGKLYVSLQEKLLFKSGSADVDPKGKEALKSLAAVLNTTPNISVMIEGHTDNVPMAKGKFDDNWALSVGRATSIVRILTKEYKVDSKSIIAAGRSEYFPVDDNATTEGKARNRRIEIILTPDLNELFKLLNQ